MRICILQSSYTSDSHRSDPTRWLPEHTCEHHYIDKATANRQVFALARGGFDVFINLCDGCEGDDEAGIEVVHALERLGVAFTGADSGFYAATREAMKLAACACGLSTPHFMFVDGPAGADLAAERLRFPLLVKHPNGYSSVGMTRGSRVDDVEALRAEVARFVDGYGGALIEEFIAGREFTALVVEGPGGEPVAFTPIEVHLPPGESFKHHALKWEDFEGITNTAVADAALRERLADASSRLFAAIDGSGYGRCDFRLADDGELHVLEINTNPGVFYPTDLAGSVDEILFHDDRGHRGFLDLILDAAQRRARARARRCGVASNTRDGVYLYALAEIAAGELVVPGERQRFQLATRPHQGAPRAGEFLLDRELVAVWREQPGQWRPLRHACDPNAWFRGLDLVARRPIARGEAITVDHATLAVDFAAFTCACGSSECRGVVRGDDHASPTVIGKYGDHVAPAVRAAIRAAAP